IGRQDQHTAEICSYLAHHFRFVLDKAPQLLINEKLPGESGTVSTKEAVFSGRVYVYHESYLPAEETVRLSRIFKNEGVSAIFRSVDYLSTKRSEATVRMLRTQQEQSPSSSTTPLPSSKGVTDTQAGASRYSNLPDSE